MKDKVFQSANETHHFHLKSYRNLGDMFAFLAPGEICSGLKEEQPSQLKHRPQQASAWAEADEKQPELPRSGKWGSA